MKKVYEYIIPALVLSGLIIFGVLYLLGHKDADHIILMVTLTIGTIPLAVKIFRALLKGEFGVDLIAILAIVTSFVQAQYLAGCVILLMLSGGEALEIYALNRAKRELTNLLSRAPSVAHLKKDNELKDIEAGQVKIGNILVVKPGEIIPTDGIVAEGESNVDEAAITGESLPVLKQTGNVVFSGSLNKDRAFIMWATHEAKESQYQKIVNLVKQAQEEKSPVVRLADRYAGWFTAITLVIAIGAWLLTQEPIRFLAVLVVATPCPLILATPIAMMSGISKAASRGIVIKNGSALEILGEAKTFVFDKTGTLTLGTPRVVGVKAFNGFQEKDVLHFAASLDQLSSHIFARSLIEHARKDKLNLYYPENFAENLGNGVKGRINSTDYIFGRLKYLEDQGIKISEKEKHHRETEESLGEIPVYLGSATNNALLGYVIFADVIRPEMKDVFAKIGEHKIQKILMLTGDKKAVAEKIAKEIGLKNFLAEMLPENKVKVVKELPTSERPVVMVGDGINDAPALAAAEVGIAMGAHGSSAASEAADVVITQNNMVRVHDALHIGQRALSLAKQSIFVGMGVSIILMFIASLGFIPPILGAIFQEALDVAVILNALRLNFEKIT
jgi:heavy metal translocating P-type ATPase